MLCFLAILISLSFAVISIVSGSTIDTLSLRRILQFTPIFTLSLSFIIRENIHTNTYDKVRTITILNAYIIIRYVYVYTCTIDLNGLNDYHACIKCIYLKIACLHKMCLMQLCILCMYIETISPPLSSEDITVTVLSSEDVQVTCPQPLNCLVLIQSLTSLNRLHVLFFESFITSTIFSVDTVSNDSYVVVYSWDSEQSIFDGKVSLITSLDSPTSKYVSIILKLWVCRGTGSMDDNQRTGKIKQKALTISSCCTTATGPQILASVPDQKPPTKPCCGNYEYTFENLLVHSPAASYV